MRCSCARSSLAALAVLPAVLSCASAPPAPDRPERFRLEGTVRVEGSGPFERRISVIDESGAQWELAAGALESDLRLLDGYTVGVLCSARAGGGSHAVTAESYLIIPPDGSIAVLGEIGLDGSSVTVTEDDRVHALSGALIDALRAHEGMRAWVWGEGHGRGGAIAVTGYEVLGPACP
ncbi:MAG: hypothetical protein PHQ19_03290 [Candidatus Krumholzibacteria bacterium]|nr:hypothetical protein [Candidatus Krumholzibacteria bacterium]